VLEHNISIHNVNEYMANENIFIEYDYTGGGSFEDISIEDQWDYIDIDSRNLKINTNTKLNSFENNGNITHTENISDDHIPYHGDNNNITNTYGSFENNIKFINSCINSTEMQGDLLICTFNGYTSVLDEERSMAGNVPCINNSNISQSILTKLNNNSNEFTFVFLTNK